MSFRSRRHDSLLSRRNCGSGSKRHSQGHISSYWKIQIRLTTPNPWLLTDLALWCLPMRDWCQDLSCVLMFGNAQGLYIKHMTPPPTSFLVISRLSLMTNTIQEGRRWTSFGQKSRSRVVELMNMPQRRGCEEERKQQSHFLLFMKSSGGCMWVLLDKRIRTLGIYDGACLKSQWFRGPRQEFEVNLHCTVSQKRRRRIKRKRKKLNKIRRKRRRKKQQQWIQCMCKKEEEVTHCKYWVDSIVILYF